MTELLGIYCSLALCVFEWWSHFVMHSCFSETPLLRIPNSTGCHPSVLYKDQELVLLLVSLLASMGLSLCLFNIWIWQLHPGGFIFLTLTRRVEVSCPGHSCPVCLGGPAPAAGGLHSRAHCVAVVTGWSRPSASEPGCRYEGGEQERASEAW